MIRVIFNKIHVSSQLYEQTMYIQRVYGCIQLVKTINL